MINKIIIFIFLSSINIYSYKYPEPIIGYFSQKGQDKFLNENIFKNKEKGFFVEIGAHDGISFSNTYYFEKYLGWHGICIEPNPEIFKKLTGNRKCYCEQVCISSDFGVKEFLKCSGYILEMYSGLLSEIDPRHMRRIDDEIKQFGGSKEIILVNCTTLSDIFLKHKINYIDLLSIDIEGGEEAAIKTINFDKIKINIIVIENNFNENKIRNFLFSKGYKHLTRVGKDDIYQIKGAHE